jgi:hypothetical protein
MKTRFHVLLPFVVGMAAFSSQVSASVVFFDDFTGDAGGTVTSLTNWTVAGGNVDVLVGSCSGSTCIDLEGTPGVAVNSTITTSLDLVAGNYSFEFNYGNNSGGPNNTLTYDFGGGLVSGTIDTDSLSFTTLDTFTGSFTLASAFTGFDISFTSGGPADNSGSVLNSVTLTQVPEPSTLALLALGFLGIGARRRRIH